MTEIQKTISPVDGSVYVERPLATDALLQRTMERARHAQSQWKLVPLGERIDIVNRFIDSFVARKEKIAEEISWQMGRPISQSPGEVRGFVKLTRQYRLGNPIDATTNLGPMVRARAAEFARGQVREAIAAGAKSLVDAKAFPADKAGTPYMAPQVLVNVNHSMRLMNEESFTPVIGIMKVKGDDEAIALMNDSRYGLTAAIWTSDEDAALSIGDRVETGTWFMNRCDYLDPALAWTGVKDSGRGCTLSRIGYEQITRPKSYHLRLTT